MSYVYLASPYTHEDPEVMNRRYEQTAEWVANRLKEYGGPVIYSPILHCHYMAVTYNLPKTVN